MKNTRSFLICEFCLSHNYKLNRKSNRKLLNLNKYCKKCKKVTSHYESF